MRNMYYIENKKIRNDGYTDKCVHTHYVETNPDKNGRTEADI